MIGRRRGDPPPDSPRAVLLVVLGPQVSATAVDQALVRAAGAPIAVLALLKIHGYAMGFPNPGLLPTAAERGVQLDLVNEVIGQLEKGGAEVDGQIAATRNPVRAITGVARRRQVGHVVIDRPVIGRVRRTLEGDVASGVRRRLAPAIDVVVTEAPAAVATSRSRSRAIRP
ncbi:MAG TPA: hypothetical protein VHT75_13205 [Acidimicrobiales bacterium]|nr:hypothetical protein [Acidimicrobiales bacterium]